MGDASPPRQHILCVLPFPEPHDIFKKIKAKHPNVDFSYQSLQFTRGKISTPDIPDGILPPNAFFPK